jgi:hypothetical protein
MNVLKGKNALDKYGEDGANGVIDIILRKINPLKSATENQNRIKHSNFLKTV